MSRAKRIRKMRARLRRNKWRVMVRFWTDVHLNRPVSREMYIRFKNHPMLRRYLNVHKDGIVYMGDTYGQG